MALTNANNYTFNSRQDVLDFVTPLIVEGYPVVIQTVFDISILDANKIDHYEVSIGEKRKPIKVMIEQEEDNEN